ncbi:tRNA lysidine(34) synthetase TilS [Parasphingorhabdus sp.]|uniref:tRNA lysidine(34) synthetase TilS n=1 Tax=Parasphingorhabdus sp. TaxID=2709688 RepID=UPI003262D97E
MPDPDIIARFSDAIAQLIPGFFDNDEKLGLAVSGGPDSLALLLLANATFPDRIAAASVDHGLRPAAHQECEFVAAICADKNIRHQILKPTIPIRGSIQSEARKVRYALLNKWAENNAIGWLATAHHADDQLETLIMRILRGSGIDGMSAIRSRRGNIVRPLLHFPKTMLADFVKSQNIIPVEDPSNADNSFDRVRIRKALSELNGFDVSLASQSAAALDDARTALQWMIDELSLQHVHKTDAGCTLDRTDFPHEIIRRLVLKCLHICQPAVSPRGAQLERTILALQHNEKITIGDVLCQGGKTWTFSPAPKRRDR